MKESGESPKLELTDAASKTVFPILFAISFCHLLNDTIQSLLPAIYPILKNAFRLNFTQIGFITLGFQLTASILQPFVGLYSDKRPHPYSLVIGMIITMAGLIMLAFAPIYGLIIVSVCFIGMGSSIFHPEASRIAHLASGGKSGTAQSLFQLGGNSGGAMGPLLASFIIAPFGKIGVLWFTLLALLAIVIQLYIGRWYREHINEAKLNTKAVIIPKSNLPRSKIVLSLLILIVLIFSKYFYLASISSYYTFYLIHKFHISIAESQLFLFLFLISAAAGTMLGGPIGDKYGRKYVIWVSILGVAPFTLILPHVTLFWCAVLTVPIGIIISSAFSAILVYAQELFPGKVGLIAGLFFGLAFGMGGIGSAVMGIIADRKGIEYVFYICSFLPLIGIITGFLPSLEPNNMHL